MDPSVQFAKSAKVLGMGVPLNPTSGDMETEGDWFILGNELPHGRLAPASQLGVKGRIPRSLRILLVDDTFSSRRLAELILKHAGHFVVVASNGKEAVELATDSTLDVIVMDLQMPVLNGWQATQAIRRYEKLTGRSHSVPIIALTAYNVAGNRQRSLEIGMNEFLTKPLDPQLLIEMVEKHGLYQPDEPR